MVVQLSLHARGPVLAISGHWPSKRVVSCLWYIRSSFIWMNPREYNSLMHGCKSRFAPSGFCDGYAHPLGEWILGFWYMIAQVGLHLVVFVWLLRKLSCSDYTACRVRASRIDWAYPAIDFQVWDASGALHPRPLDSDTFILLWGAACST